MSTATLFPTSETDVDNNIVAGAFTDLDDGIAGDGSTLDSRQNGWANQVNSTTGGFFSFGLTDAPGDFDSFTSIKLQVRAQVTTGGSGDTTTYRADISGTNAPTNSVEWIESEAGSGFQTPSFTNSSVTPSASDINGWVVRVYQWQYNQDKGPDGLNLEIDEIELTLTYVAGAGGPAKAVFGHHQFRITT